MEKTLDRRGTSIREVILGVTILVLGAALLKFADLPTRVSVIEADHASLKDAVRSIDSKIDILIQRGR